MLQWPKWEKFEVISGTNKAYNKKKHFYVCIVSIMVIWPFYTSSNGILEIKELQFLH